MKKAKFKVNNKMKAYGQMDPKTNNIEVNLKKHRGDKRELADTIKHEMLHVKHPKASEKEVTKLSQPELSRKEQDQLIAKIRMKKINQKMGAIKRKYKMDPADNSPGSLIKKSNESKLTKQRVAIMGMV